MTSALNKKINIWAALTLIPAALVATGCSKSSAAPNARRPPDVKVIAVEQKKDIPIYREWIGTLDGMVNAAIRAQVTGYLLKQDYAEGSFVRKGQLVFEIDPRPFKPLSIRRRDNSRKRTGGWRKPRRSSSMPKRGS